MTTRSVWAPAAARVELVRNGARSCARGADGWWHVDDPGLGPGADYAFAVDGGAPLPDPRSAWQPAGVHGPSRVVDHGAFAWTDRGWQAPPLAAAVIYELHVGTFTPAGTFDGALARLDHLVDLGVTHLEVMPIAEFSGARGWGYDGVFLFAPHAAYGGPDGFKRFVDACHARGLAVLLDVVYNHLGPVGNYLDRFAPYFTDRYHTAWGRALNFDGRGSDEVRRFVCDNALAWLRDYHVDGLRLDAVHAIVDTSAEHILEQLAREVRALAAALGRYLVLIAESDANDPRLDRAPSAGGYGFDAQWNDDFHHALHAWLTGEGVGYYADFGTLADVARTLRHGWVYDGRYSAFRQRRHGRPARGVAGSALVGFLQNHDQIGNRARGERLAALVSPARQALGAALVATAPFVPLLFQGEEWGASTPFQYFTAHEDPEVAAAVQRGRRQELAAFGWAPDDVPDPQDPATFARSTLDWDERDREPHAELLTWYRRLLALRRRLPALADGRRERVRVRYDEAAGWLVMARGDVAVVVNGGDHARDVPLDAEGAVVLAAHGGVTLAARAVRVARDGVAVLGFGTACAALARSLVVLLALASFAGCTPPAPPAPAPPPVAPAASLTAPPSLVKITALAATIPRAGELPGLVGRLHEHRVAENETLLMIGRAAGVGLRALRAANPILQRWVPRPGTELVVATRFILPPSGYRGLVVNVAEMRLYMFPPDTRPGERVTLRTWPVGIGAEVAESPVGRFTITTEDLNPTWVVPDSIYDELEFTGHNVTENTVITPNAGVRFKF